MSITFTEAPTVAVGDPITSTHLADCAAAMNDRTLAGFDITHRIRFWWLNLFRSLRNADGLDVPAEAEALESYQFIEPDDGTWPTASPGDPQGANLFNPLGLYVFGDGASYDDEATRLSAVPLTDVYGSQPVSVLDHWNLGVRQRGMRDPTTGDIFAPALNAAQSYATPRFSVRSAYGNSFGAWLPGPEILSTACQDPNTGDDYPAPVNYEIKFKAIVGGYSDKTYAGTCQPGPDVSPSDAYDSHVAYILYFPWAYVVILNDGTTDVLPRSAYVEGPYTGPPVLTKQPGEHIPRVLNQFVREFRGDSTQVGSLHVASPPSGFPTTSWGSKAFNVREFMATQYYLAPARGLMVDEVLETDYPTWEFGPASGQTTVASGTLGSLDPSGTSRALHADYVGAGWIIVGTGLVGSVTVELLVDGSAAGTLEISDASPQAAAWFPTAIDSGTLSCRLATVATFTDDTGTIEVQAAELYRMKPQHHDLFLLLRLSGIVDQTNTVDGAGIQRNDSAEMWESYADHGCVVSRDGESGLPSSSAEINTNAVFDAARRMSMMLRCITEDMLHGYEVTGGKSILYFKRTKTVAGVTVDPWEGIVDAIATDAPTRGWSNRWVLDVELFPYGETDSTYDPDTFAKRFAIFNRAHFYSPDVYYDKKLLWHFALGLGSGGVVYRSEAPSGWNYAPTRTFAPGYGWVAAGYSGHKNVNEKSCSGGDETCKKFYASNPIYKPPLEIESAEAISESGTDLVKVTLSGRMQSTVGWTNGAPSSVAYDRSGWSATLLGANGYGGSDIEPFRTDENGVRAWLIHGDDGTDFQKLIGDYALNASSAPSSYGCIFPRFWLTKLAPEPYDDGNDGQHAVDSPIWHDFWSYADLWLRCACESFVDPTSTASLNGCDIDEYESCTSTGHGLYCYTFENLLYDANGGKWLYPLPTAATAKTSSRYARTDKPYGFGALPQTFVTAEGHNQFANAINLLTRVPVYLPFKLQYKSTQKQDNLLLGTDDVDECGYSEGGASHWGATSQTPVAPSTVTYEDTSWQDADSYGFYAESKADLGFVAADDWRLTSTRRTTVYRWSLIDPNAEEAVPDSWSDMLSTSLAGLFCQKTSLVTVDTSETTPGCSGSPYIDFDPCGFTINENGGWSGECVLLTEGTLDAGAIGAGWFYYGYDDATATECAGGYNKAVYVFPITLQPEPMLTVPLA